MTLTKEHIDLLYTFTRKHFVEHYDLQTELVDHLANDIEEIWKENSSYSFSEARNAAFKKFGVFGFMDVVAEKQKQMTRKYWKILWRFMKEWFTIPKIICTLTLLVGYFTLLRLEASSFILAITLLSLAVFIMVCQAITTYKSRLKKKRKERIFLLEEMIHSSKSWFIVLSLINMYNAFELIDVRISDLALYWIFAIASVLTALTIMFYIVEFVIPAKSKDLLEEVYPEYKFSRNL